MSRRCWPRPHSSSCGGTSNDESPAEHPVCRARWRRCSRLATAVQVVRDRDICVQRCPTTQVLYVRIGEVMQQAALSYDAVLADVYWIRALQHYRSRAAEASRATAVRSAVSAARPRDDARSAIYGRLPVRRHLSRRAASRWRGPARPGDRAARRKGLRANPDKWDYYHDIGFIYYWNLHDYREGGRVVQAWRRAAGRAVVAEDVCGRDADARRRSPGVASDVAAARVERRERMAAADGAAAA